MSLGDAVGGRVARSAHARLALTMPRDGAITFRDIAGKLTVLRFGHAHVRQCGRSDGARGQRFMKEPTKPTKVIPSVLSVIVWALSARFGPG